VIITTLRRAPILAETLRSFEALDVDGLGWELLLLDNAGGDPATREVATAFGTRLPIQLVLEPRPGVNHARNRAVERARGELIVFADDDITPAPEWLRQLREGAGRWPEAYVFGGRVLPAWPTSAAVPADHEFFAHAYAIADWSIPEGPYSAHRVFGPNMAYRASVFRDGWRFDPRIGPDGTDRYMTGSETSFNLALERAGFVAIYLPGARVHHRVRPEQLALTWLYRRSFRLGRWEAYLGPHRVERTASLRRLLTALTRSYLRFARARLRGDPAEALDAGLAYWRLRGVLHQRYRRH